MKLKNILIVVSDIEKSKVFYQDLFGLKVITDFGENVILTEGLVLQEQTVWEEGIKRKVCQGAHNAELYFEEVDMDGFLEKLESSSFEIEYLTKGIEENNGKRIVRIYDPDKHIIEVGERF